MTEPQGHQEARAAIRPVKEGAEDELLAKAGVVAVDIAEKESEGKPTGDLSIVVYVEKKQPLTKLSAANKVPKEIDGIPTDVQEMQIELQAVERLEDEALVDTSDYPTLKGGISIGPQRSIYLTPPAVPNPGNYTFVGTLGAMVKDRNTGAAMGLTNFHVACVDSTWAVGNRQVQPGRPDGGAVSDDFGQITRAVLSTMVDGAVLKVDDGQPWVAEVAEIGAVAGKQTAAVGMAVQKRGRTTEHTYGSVSSVDFTVTVPYGDGIGSRTLRHQIRINTDASRSARFSDRGDSGSVIMTQERKVVGLLFAGSTDGRFTFANPIQSVLDELDVDLLEPPVVTVTRPLVTCLRTRLTVLCPTRDLSRCFTRDPSLCFVRTRNTPLCDIDIRTRFVCRPPWPGIPGRPGQFGDLGEDGSSEGHDGEDYLAGYLAALEEVAAVIDGATEQE